MAFGNLGGQNRQPMAEINTTPLVDVMLVLLVIFIITAPLFTHAIKLELPSAQAPAAPEKPSTITISVDAKGDVFWNNEPIGTERPIEETLKKRFGEAALKQPLPEVQIRADKQTRFQSLATIMSTAQQAGLIKLGFVTEDKDEKK